MSKFVPQYTPDEKARMITAAADELTEDFERYVKYLRASADAPSNENIATARKAIVGLAGLLTRDIIPLLNTLSPAAPQPVAQNGSQPHDVDLVSILG